jgi:toxin ParE1/3/4
MRGFQKTGRVNEPVEKALPSLSENPHRGGCPEELLALGLRGFRQVFFKPYRVIENNVYGLLITDGRRDMQKLLERRLLHG